MTLATACIVARALRLEPWRGRMVLLAGGIALGTSLFVALAAVHDAAVRLSAGAMVPPGSRAHLWLQGAAAGVPDTLVAVLRADPGVAAAVPVLRRRLRVAGGEDTAFDLVGLDLLDATGTRHGGASAGVTFAGDPLLVLARPDAVLLPATLARRLGVRPGDVLPVVAPAGVRVLHVHGLVHGLPGAATATMMMDLEAAQRAFGRVGWSDGIEIVLRDPVAWEVVVARLASRLPVGVTLAPTGTSGDLPQQGLRAFRALVETAGALALVLGVFLVHGAVANAVAVRRDALAIVRVLGGRRRGVVGVVVGGVLVAAVLGATSGAGLGLGLAALLRDTVVHALGLELGAALDPAAARLDPGRVPLGIGIGILAAAVGAAVPAWRGAEAPLRRASVSVPPQRWRSRGAVLGAATLALAAAAAGGVGPAPHAEARAPVVLTLLVLAGAITVGPLLVLWQALLGAVLPRLGTRGALLALAVGVEPPARTRVLLGGIALGVATLVTLAALQASVEGSVERLVAAQLRGDLVVTSRTGVGAFDSAALALHVERTVARTPGVARVVSMRVLPLRHAGATIRMRVIGGAGDDRALVAALLRDGDPDQALAALRGAAAVLVSRNFGTRFHVRTGDVLTLATPVGPQRLRVAGVLDDLGSATGAVTIGRATYRRYWADEHVNALELHLAPDADPGVVARVLEARLGGDADLHVRSVAAFRHESIRRVRGAFGFLRAVEIACLLVALLALADDLLATTVQRRGELAVLRAIGGTRRQVTMMVVAGAVLLTTGGVLVGLLWGALLARGWLAVHLEALVGFAVDFHVPIRAALRTAAAVVLAAALAALASVWATRRVSIGAALRDP